MNASRRLAVTTVATVGSLLLLAAPAFAHVSVQPGEAEQGSYATINFKVPNERDDASTVKLEVSFPADHPLASVMPQPVPGWEVKVTKSKLDKPLELHGSTIDEAVTKVTWTAGKIDPGQFQQFPLSVGQLPEDADELVFKALQTYSNKEVVRWIEETKEGEDEPENPAPVLKLTAAEGDSGHSHGSGSSADSDSGSADNASTDDEGSDAKTAAASDNGEGDGGSDTTARVLAVVGVVIGAAGVAFGVLAGRRRSA